MSNQNTKFAAKEVMDATLYDMSTNKPVARFDTLKASGVSATSETVYLRDDKGNPKLPSEILSNK